MFIGTTTKIASSHPVLSLMVGNSNGNLNYCIVTFIECGTVLFRIKKELIKPLRIKFHFDEMFREI